MTVVALHRRSQQQAAAVSSAVVHEGFNVSRRTCAATADAAPDMPARLVEDIQVHLPAGADAATRSATASAGRSRSVPPAAPRRVPLAGAAGDEPPSGSACGRSSARRSREAWCRRCSIRRRAVVGWEKPLDAFRTIVAPTLIITSDRTSSTTQDNLDLYKKLPRNCSSCRAPIPGLGTSPDGVPRSAASTGTCRGEHAFRQPVKPDSTCESFHLPLPCKGGVENRKGFLPGSGAANCTQR